MPAQLWISVATSGCFFALIALSYLFIMDGAGVFNFALGTYTMFSALGSSYFAFEHGFPLWAAVITGVLTAVALALLTELIVVRPIEARTANDELPALVAIVAVLFAIQQFAGTVYGQRPLAGQFWLSTGPIFVGSVVIDPQTIVLAGATLVIFGTLAVWLRWARYGQMLRAVGDNQRAARMLGLPVNRIRLMAFGIAGAVAGIAGPLFSPQAGVSFHSGLSYALYGFLAFVVGGTGTVWAPLVGALVLASVQTWSSYWFGAAWLDYITLVLALVFFAFRPEGIFARKVRL